jgi:hypothetical protein
MVPAAGRRVANDYYTSKAGRRLHKRAGVKRKDKNTSVYELGFDFIQPFKSKVHSTGFLSIR